MQRTPVKQIDPILRECAKYSHARANPIYFNRNVAEAESARKIFCGKPRVIARMNPLRAVRSRPQWTNALTNIYGNIDGAAETTVTLQWSGHAVSGWPITNTSLRKHLMLPIAAR